MSAWYCLCLQVYALPEAVVSPLGTEPCQWAAASKPGNNRNRAHLLLHSGFCLYFVWLFFFPMFTAPPGYLEFTSEFFFALSLQLLQDTYLWPQSLRETMNNSTVGFWTSCCGHPARGAGLVSILQPADPGCKPLTRARLCSEVGMGGGGLSSLPSKAYSSQRTGGFKGSEWDD